MNRGVPIPNELGWPCRELRNKIIRIGLHGLCGYIKLERGRIGGAKGDSFRKPP